MFCFGDSYLTSTVHLLGKLAPSRRFETLFKVCTIPEEGNFLYIFIKVVVEQSVKQRVNFSGASF
jgi:hypothetical protein